MDAVAEDVEEPPEGELAVRLEVHRPHPPTPWGDPRTPGRRSCALNTQNPRKETSVRRLCEKVINALHRNTAQVK